MSTGQPQIRLGDIASVIRVTVKDGGVPLDLSTATVKTFKFKKPSGAVIERTAVFAGTGVDGVLQYVTILGDLDEFGPWQGQVYVEMGTQKFHTTVFALPVAQNLS